MEADTAMKWNVTHFDHETSTKLHQWPSPQDYNESIQHSESAFSDADLRISSPVVDLLGLPRPVSGGFASVYRLQHGAEIFAVRCFLSHVPEQQLKYAFITDFLRDLNSPYFLESSYIANGIKIQSAWFPVLKMRWQDGQTLDQFVEANLYDSNKIATLADNFATMCRTLSSLGMAHGDLQHGNILVTTTGELRLVDYDGMFVPKMNGFHCNELGHRNYQHPSRSTFDFGPNLDKFSACVIYSSLKILAEAPSVYHSLNASESLLWRAADFAEPNTSANFALLESHENEVVRRWARLMRWQSGLNVAELSFLWDLPPDAPGLPPITLAPHPKVVPEAALVNSVCRTPVFYQDKWWRVFLDRSDLIDGIEPELLRPGRTVKSPYLGGNVWMHLFLVEAIPLFLVTWVTLNIVFGVHGAMLFGMAALVAFFCGTLPAAKQLRLFYYGRPARGKLTTVKLGMLYAHCSLEYNVLQQDGFVNKCAGSVRLPMANFRGEYPSVGDQLTVLYDPDEQIRVVVPKYAVFLIKPDPEPKLTDFEREESSPWEKQFLSNAKLSAYIEPELRHSVRTDVRHRRIFDEDLSKLAITTGIASFGALIPSCSSPSGLVPALQLVCILGVFAAPYLGAALLLPVLLRLRRQIAQHKDRELCKTGRAASALVTRLGNIVGLAILVSLQYEVLTDNGEIISVSTTIVLPVDLAKHLSVGERVTVLYNEGKHQLPVIYKLCHFEVL